MSSIRGTVEDDSFLVTYEFNQPLTKVSVYDADYDVQAVAYARVSEPDVYDEQIGYELAFGRALRRLLSKREKLIIRDLSA